MSAAIEFRRWKDSAEVVKAAEETALIGEQYLRLASSNKNEDRPQKLKVWQQLSAKYWDLLFAIVDAQTESFPETLNFDEEERLFIDFGYLNDILTPRSPKFDTALVLRSQAVPGAFQYQAFSDFIAESWGMITGQSVPCPVCGMPTEDKIERLKDKLYGLKEQCSERIRRLLSRAGSITASELGAVLSDLDKHLVNAMKVTMRTKEYREANDEVKQGMSQDRFRYYEAERVMNLQLSIAQKDEEDPLGLPELDEFLDLYESSKTLARKIIYSLQEDEKRQRRSRMISVSCAQFSQQMMRRELKNVIIKKKDYMAVPAKLARCEQSFLCPSDAEPVLYETLSGLSEDMSAADISMYGVSRVRMYGVPRVIFVPGQGWGTYDWLDHTVLLPVFPSTSAEKAVAYGLAAFRWDSDEDRVLKNPYEMIKDNKGKSILELASSFCKDYFLWLTKEKKGYRILPRGTHKTFVQMFAPGGTED